MNWYSEWRNKKSAHKALYTAFSRLINDPSDTLGKCWVCGRTASDKPIDWAAPWLMTRMHIVNKPRLEDRRVVISACQICHENYDGGNVEPGKERILLEHALYIKQFCDPECPTIFFDGG